MLNERKITIREKEKQIKELEMYLKALIFKIGNNIEITASDIEKVQNGRIYYEQEYLRHGKIFKVVFPKDFLGSEENGRL